MGKIIRCFVIRHSAFVIAVIRAIRGCLSPPEFVTVTGTVLFVPTVTLPKLALLGLAVNDPDDMPVPERAMLSGELDASETMLTAPLAAPVLVGAKVVMRVTL